MSAQKTSKNTDFGGAGIFWTSRADSTLKTTPYKPILSPVRPKMTEIMKIAARGHGHGRKRGCGVKYLWRQVLGAMIKSTNGEQNNQQFCQKPIHF